MHQVTIVTAFFDIGRENFRTLPRSSEVYFEHFHFWARIQNPLVVYTSRQFRERILEIRSEFGLGDLTKVFVIDDPFAIQPEIFARMSEVSRDHWFRDFRLLPHATSGIAEYSYLMLLKSWFVSNAVSRGVTTETAAWIDFGFNHGGVAYPHTEEFDFAWRCEKDEYDKVVLFSMDEYDDRPIFEIVRRLSDCLMGAPIIIPSRRASELWDVNRESMQTLLRVGLIDDDQLIQMMSLRARPELFEVRRSEWFRPLKDVSGAALTLTAPQEPAIPLRPVRTLVRWSRRQRRALQSSARLYVNLVKGRP